MLRSPPANEVDSPEAAPLLKEAKNIHPDIKIDSSYMDAAYDNYEKYRFAIEETDAASIIALNLTGRIDALVC